MQPAPGRFGRLFQRLAGADFDASGCQWLNLDPPGDFLAEIQRHARLICRACRGRRDGESCRHTRAGHPDHMREWQRKMGQVRGRGVIARPSLQPARAAPRVSQQRRDFLCRMPSGALKGCVGPIGRQGRLGGHFPVFIGLYRRQVGHFQSRHEARRAAGIDRSHRQYVGANG